MFLFCNFKYSLIFAAMDGGVSFFWKFSGFISHNVPAVYDVFATRIRACVARPGLQKCG
jgi:hypothetical protein